MCGIWGSIINKALQSQSAQPESLSQKIRHRGPDETTSLNLDYGNYSISLVFHRLAIVDITNGHQPFVHETDERIVVCMANGEIYNYLQIITDNLLDTKSDCHVILDLYLKKGVYETCRELDGEFAFVILDIQKKTNEIEIFLARDRFGIRPLFIGKDLIKKQIYFSSELKGIPASLFTVHVEPRKILNINLNDKALTFNKQEYYKIYTNLSANIPNEIECNEIYEKIRHALIKSVADRLYSERPLGCLLSGGLDSSLIAGIASRLLKEKGHTLNTFSIGMSENSPDVYYAQMVADYIGSNHTTVVIPPEKWIETLPRIIYQIETFDTTTIRASTGQYLLGKWISENTNIKVLLNGDGSDEIASGYLYFYNAPSAQESSLENKRLLENIHYYDVLRVDRGISAHGLEARVPFLCHHFVDTYLSVPPELRRPVKNEKIEKYLLRKSFESENLIPAKVLWRKKEAFSDGVSNQEKSWYQLIEESIPADFQYSPIYVGPVKPVTKESQFFRKYFDFYYPYKYHILETNEYWLPRWSGNVLNPSARVLSVYQE